MADVSAAIRRYINNVIPLSQKDIAASAKSRNWFLDRLKNEASRRKYRPMLYGETPFINFGSYFKGTKVSDADEFDILVVIDSNTGQFSQQGIVVGNGLGTALPNHKYDNDYYIPGTHSVSSKKMISWFKNIVNTVIHSYDGKPAEDNGISIMARLESKNVNLDLVPCGVFEKPYTNERFYNIGDGEDGWTLTAPRKDIDRINRIAQGKENFKNIIRVGKRIKDQYSLDLMSFAIETAIADHVDSRMSFTWFLNDLATNTIHCLRAVESALLNVSIPDPYDNSRNLLDRDSYETEAKLYGLICDYLEQVENILGQNECDTLVHNMFEANITQ